MTHISREIIIYNIDIIRTAIVFLDLFFFFHLRSPENV